MKRIFSTIVLAAAALSSFAGGLLTNTNQHASFVRNPARYASLETDAIYFNPAGTAFFNEGWALSANWQMIWQDRDVTSALTNKSYKGEVYVPCMPTIMAASCVRHLCTSHFSFWFVIQYVFCESSLRSMSIKPSRV